jgi:hypothetical protein
MSGGGSHGCALMALAILSASVIPPDQSLTTRFYSVSVLLPSFVRFQPVVAGIF